MKRNYVELIYEINFRMKLFCLEFILVQEFSQNTKKNKKNELKMNHCNFLFLLSLCFGFKI